MVFCDYHHNTDAELDGELIKLADFDSVGINSIFIFDATVIQALLQG